MAQRKRRRRNRPSKARSTAALKAARKRARRSVAARRRNALVPYAPKRSRSTLSGLFGRRSTPKRHRNARAGSELASYRRAIQRYGSRRGQPYMRRRNAGAAAMSMAKSTGVALLQGGAGFTSSMLIGHFVGQAVGSQYGSLLGNVLTTVGSEILMAKVPRASFLGHSFSVGAGVAAFYNIVTMLVQRGILTGAVAQYMAPWYAAPPAPVVVVTDAGATDGNVVVSNGDGTGAVVRQASLYGMGSNPLQAAMQHRLRMIEGGMSGGIFDSKTTLGEYDILESAPQGTSVQQGLAEYQVYPPSMGATVRQATAGMGATVQEAFAGARGLREYVSMPMSGLRDYVNIGDQPVQYWSQTSSGRAILSQIRDAARRITAQRAASGQPVDAQFRNDLTRAALAAVQGQERDVSMAAPTAPLTESAAPFPGQMIADVGGVYGQPTSIQGVDAAMDESDGGIFA